MVQKNLRSNKILGPKKFVVQKFGKNFRSIKCLVQKYFRSNKKGVQNIWDSLHIWSCLFIWGCLITLKAFYSTLNSSRIQSSTASWNYSGLGQFGLGGKHMVIILSQFNWNFNCLLELSLAKMFLFLQWKYFFRKT